jgi:hypothetical protein
MNSFTHLLLITMNRNNFTISLISLNVCIYRRQVYINLGTIYNYVSYLKYEIKVHYF